VCLFNIVLNTSQKTRIPSSIITDERNSITEDISRLTDETTEEYNDDEYMSLYFSVSRNIKLYCRLRVTDQYIGIYSSVTRNRQIYWWLSCPRMYWGPDPPKNGDCRVLSGYNSSHVSFVHNFDSITPLFSDHTYNIGVTENNGVTLSKLWMKDMQELA
jgi:hypothetical protein